MTWVNGLRGPKGEGGGGANNGNGHSGTCIDSIMELTMKDELVEDDLIRISIDPSPSILRTNLQ